MAFGQAPRRLTLASRLRDKVTLQRQTDIKKPTGGYDRSWADVEGMTGIAAEVVSQNGREAVIAGSLQGTNSYKITIRLAEGEKRPRAADRLVYRPFGADADEEINIRSVVNDPFLPREALNIYGDTESPQGL